MNFRLPIVNKNLIKSRWRQQILLTVLLMLFGFILMSHIQSVNDNTPQVYAAEQYKARQEQLKQVEQQNAKLMQENARLTKSKEQAIANLLTGDNEQLLEDINRIKLIAGFTEVQGRGLVMTLNDKPDYDILKDPLDSIVHDADVRYAVDLLRGSGALAISINGYRIVNSTYILCIGPTILVNNERLVPPYVISAVGDTDSMLTALDSDLYFEVRRQQPTGIVVESKVLDKVAVPPFTEVDRLDKYISLLEVSR